MSTGIEWTDETWNPVTGCTKVSQGCKNCYAERLWPKVEGARVKREGGAPRPFTRIMNHFDRLQQPLHWKRPRRVFVNSMSDLFHEEVDRHLIDIVLAMMSLATQHTFQILTKRPQRMHDYLSDNQMPGRVIRAARIIDQVRDRAHPPQAMKHVWLGVSVEDQATADERIPLLLQTPAAVRFVSYEPALGPVDFLKWKIPGHKVARALSSGKGDPCINWIIAGGESGPHARPAHPDWFRSARDQCAAAGVPFFFKQWGEFSEYTEAADHEYKWHKLGLKVRWPLGDSGGAVASDLQWYRDQGAAVMRPIGKKTAGRQLDGRTHDEYPA